MVTLLPALILLAAALASQPAPPPQRPPAARPWQVDWGQYYCSLIRRGAEDRPWAAAFLTVPGDDKTVLMLVPDERAHRG